MCTRRRTPRPTDAYVANTVTVCKPRTHATGSPTSHSLSTATNTVAS